MMPLHTAKEEMLNYGEHVDTLIALHHRTVDALAGYAKMVEKAEPSFRPVAEEFRSLHTTQAQRMEHILADLGEEIDPDGTFMGTVNAAVVSVRAMFDAIDEGVMGNIRNGEDSVLGAFDDAIAASPDPTTTAALIDMRSALTSLLDRTRLLD